MAVHISKYPRIDSGKTRRQWGQCTSITLPYVIMITTLKNTYLVVPCDCHFCCAHFVHVDTKIAVLKSETIMSPSDEACCFVKFHYCPNFFVPFASVVQWEDNSGRKKEKIRRRLDMLLCSRSSADNKSR